MFGLKPRGDTAQRAIQATAWGEWGDSGTTWAGPNVSTSNALQLLAVYGCNRFICEGISTLPVDVYRQLGDGTREEIAKPPWLEKPTPYLDRVAWLTQILTSLLLDGNAYLHLRYNEGRLTELVPLDPSVIQVRRIEGRKRFFINGVMAGDVDILHIPGLMFPGSDVGMSPVEMARQTIGSGMGADEVAARQFGQGLNLPGVIEVPTDMPPEGAGSAKELARQFARLHGGKNKAGLPAVLVGGAQWKVTGVTNDQAQFLQSRQFTTAQIASLMFLIDPTEFGMSMDKGSSITYSNLEQRNSRKVTVTFLPWLVRIENAISELLARPRFMKFNVKGLLRGDTLTRFQTYSAAEIINSSAVARGDEPVMLTEEMRDLEDMGPIPRIPTPPPAPAAATPVVVNNTLPPFNIDARSNVDARTSIDKDAIQFRAGDTNVAPASVNVGLSRDDIEQLALDLRPADPVINVAAPEVRVDNAAPVVTVTVPEQPAPIVNVTVPEQRKRTVRVKRDRDGRIVEAAET